MRSFGPWAPVALLLLQAAASLTFIPRLAVTAAAAVFAAAHSLIFRLVREGSATGLRVDHPDILEFVAAKRDETALRNFNCSVLVTDAFMQAAQRGDWYPLVHPRTGRPAGRLRATDVLDEMLGPFARIRNVASACSSGATALVLAMAWLRQDETLDAVVAGGTDALCRLTLSGFNALAAIDPDTLAPREALDALYRLKSLLK